MRSVLPLGCHHGEAFSLYTRQPDVVRESLRTIARAGYGFIRTWFMLGNQRNPGTGYWAGREVGPEITPTYYRKLEDFLTACRTSGLKVHLASGGLADFSDTQETWLYTGVADVLDLVGADICCLFEGVNEARDTTDHDDLNPRELERLVRLVTDRHPRVLGALTAFTGHEEFELLDRYTPRWMKFVLVHGYRGRQIEDKIRHIFGLTYEILPKVNELRRARGWPEIRLVWQGEPTGPGKHVSATDNQHELDDEGLALMAAMAAMSHQAWAYFSSPGIKFDEPFESMPGFFSVPHMINLLPRDVMSYQHLFHGGDRWRDERVLAAEGEVRCDHAADDSGNYVIIPYGPTGDHSLRIDKDFSGRVIHPGTGEVSPIELRRSRRWDVGFRRGRVLVGRIV